MRYGASDNGMKKILITVILSALLILSSCVNNVTETETQTDSETAAEVTNAQTLAELVTDETAEQQTESSTDEETEETETEEATETEPESEDTAEETKADEPDNGAYQLYKTAAEKTNGLTDMRQITQTEQRIKVTFPGDQTISSTSSESSDISVGGGRYKGKTYERVEDDGQTQTKEQEFYADGDKIYLKNGDGGYTAYNKTASEVSAVNALISKESLQINVLPESVFSNAEVKDNGDGTKTVKAAPSDASNSDALKNINALQSVFGMLGAENVKYTAKDAEYMFTVSKDGYIVRAAANMKIEISMTVAGIPVKAVSEASNVAELIDPGQPVTVDMP